MAKANSREGRSCLLEVDVNSVVIARAGILTLAFRTRQEGADPSSSTQNDDRLHLVLPPACLLKYWGRGEMTLVGVVYYFVGVASSHVQLARAK